MALGQIGKYERLDVLGHGASGIVYLAKDTLLGKQVALKQISAQGEERERVLGEARVLDRLHHRNIVQVNSVDQIDGKVLIDMEYIRGRNLQDILREQPQLDFDQAVSIASQICEGLAYAHANRTVHRDVKPANIIISDDGTVKLVDFGLAEVLGTNSFAGGAGTYAYMAPEDFRGDEQSDRQSDIWAAGVILYEMLTGARPFRPAKVKDPFSWKKAIEEDPIKPASTIRPDIPAEIDGIIEHALARPKSVRYNDAGLLAADLKRLTSVDAGEHVAALLDKHPSYRRESEPTPGPSLKGREAEPHPSPPLAKGRESEGSMPDEWTVAAISAPKTVAGDEDATVAAVAIGSVAVAPTSIVDAPAPVSVPDFPALADLDGFLRGAPDNWLAAGQALDGGVLSAWLRSMGEAPLAEVADELAAHSRLAGQAVDAPSDRLRDFLYRAGLETVQQAHARYTRAVRAFDAGRFPEASTDLRVAAYLDPSKAYHFQYLARSLRAAGDQQGAVAVFEEALRYHPSDRGLRKEYQEVSGTAVQVNAQSLDFGVLRVGQEKSLKVSLHNTAGGTLQGRVLSAPEWVRVQPPNFSTRHRQPLTLTVDSRKVWQPPSTQNEPVVLETTGGRQQIDVRVTVLPGRRGFGRAWFWYLPMLLFALAPLTAGLFNPYVGLAPGFIDAGLLAASAFVVTCFADAAWSLRWPLLAIAPFCFTAAVKWLSDHGISTSDHAVDGAVVLTTGPIVLLMVVQAIALWTSPKGWGKWQVWSTLICLAGIGAAYVLTQIR